MQLQTQQKLPAGFRFSEQSCPQTTHQPLISNCSERSPPESSTQAPTEHAPADGIHVYSPQFNEGMLPAPAEAPHTKNLQEAALP